MPEPGTVSLATRDVVKVWFTPGVSLYHWLKFAVPFVVIDDAPVTPLVASL